MNLALMFWTIVALKTHLQVERAADVGLRQGDADAADAALLQPLGHQLEAQELVQPGQVLHVKGQQEEHASPAPPQRGFQHLHHVLHVFVKTVQT